MKKIFFLLSAGAIFLSACNGSNKKVDDQPNGADSLGKVSTTNKAGINDTDRDFAKKASMANMAEAELGTTAQRRANDAQVKEYGKMMEEHHTAAQNELRGIANRHQLQVPDVLDTMHKNHSLKMNGLKGKAFDTEYINMMIKDHREAISLFENEITNGGHQDIKDYATSTLPKLRMHLQKADSIAMKLNITPQ